MKQYFILQWKRLARILPGALLILLILCAGAWLAMTALLHSDSADLLQQKFPVALCGTAEDSLLQLGITALQELDDTRFSIELLTMEEEQAKQALLSGRIDAYVVIPEGFVYGALRGNVPTMDYVTRPGNVGIAAMFQKEVTQVIGDILLAAQQGTFGVADALQGNGASELANEQMNQLCLEYIELALLRNGSYSLKNLGVGNGLELSDYLICGFGVFLLFLLALPFAPAVIRSDLSLNRLLTANGRSPWAQALTDWLVFFLGYLLLLGCAYIATAAIGIKLPFGLPGLLPTALLASAATFFLCVLARDAVSGILILFASVISMCFVCGCMYPISFFPETVQRLSVWLPAGVCREQLSQTLNGTPTVMTSALLAGYSLFLLCGGILLRGKRILRDRRAAL